MGPKGKGRRALEVSEGKALTRSSDLEGGRGETRGRHGDSYTRAESPSGAQRGGRVGLAGGV